VVLTTGHGADHLPKLPEVNLQALRMIFKIEKHRHFQVGTSKAEKTS
jgi:hypothetical protein